MTSAVPRPDGLGTMRSSHLSVSYSGVVRPPFKRGRRVRFPSRILVRSNFCPRRTMVSTSVSLTDNTGSIPVADTRRSTEQAPHAFVGSNPAERPIKTFPLVGNNSGLFTRAQTRSPCRAPRPLIPVRAMVRFHRLRLLARPLWKALHANSWFNSKTVHSTGRCLAANFPLKKIPLVAFQLGRAKNFPSDELAFSRGASGEAMAGAITPRRPVCSRARTLGSIPSTATDLQIL